MQKRSFALGCCISQQGIGFDGDAAGEHSVTLLVQLWNVVLVAGSQQGHPLVKGDAFFEALVDVVHQEMHGLGRHIWNNERMICNQRADCDDMCPSVAPLLSVCLYCQLPILTMCTGNQKLHSTLG